MSNILLADATGDSFYQIEITNHPLPNSIENKVSLKFVFLNELYMSFYIQDHAIVFKLTLLNNNFYKWNEDVIIAVVIVI